MPLFGKKALATCPICAAEIQRKPGAGEDHFESHVWEIPPGHGDASGQFSWDCKCGPAGMKWPTRSAATSGLVLHMYQRHHIPIGLLTDQARGRSSLCNDMPLPPMRVCDVQ